MNLSRLREAKRVLSGKRYAIELPGPPAYSTVEGRIIGRMVNAAIIKALSRGAA